MKRTEAYSVPEVKVLDIEPRTNLLVGSDLATEDYEINDESIFD